jgi:serine/threonine protein kinase
MSRDLEANLPASSTLEFLEALRRSGLASEERLHELHERVSQGDYESGRDELVKDLVHEGVITEFQADRLVAGNGRGLVIGRYVILDRIGAGAMGWVYKARHQLMDRLVAIKIISPSGSFGPDAIPRFLREMKIVGLLDHPNVVRAFDADQINGMSYLVMEYITGANFERLLADRGPLPTEEVVDYIAQAARGLAHAHEKGVIHRDIKPSNLALDASGVVKVLDLGLGAFVEVSGTVSRAHDDLDRGMAVGTADFMSPEQIEGLPLDGRSDLFSLGCTMYRLVSGAYAFPGEGRLERLMKRRNSRHVPITDLCPTVRYPVVAVLDRLLATRPDDRFPTASEAAAALEALIPFADQTRRHARTGDARGKPKPSPSPVSEPDVPPLDWSRIETALMAEGSGSQYAYAPGSAGLAATSATSQARIESHRRSLEADGSESGRDIQHLYRAELIQLKREITESRTEDQGGHTSPASERWIEWIEDHFGNLHEPSLGLVLIVILLTAVAISLAIVMELG